MRLSADRCGVGWETVGLGIHSGAGSMFGRAAAAVTRSWFVAG